jgi:putative toxin-antitoxin system antitoxin component (TIGR02293 family)
MRADPSTTTPPNKPGGKKTARRGVPNPFTKLLEDPAKLRGHVVRGLSPGLVPALAEHLAVSQTHLQGVIKLPQATFSRRKRQGRLTSEEGDRLMRVAEVLQLAVDLFEGDEVAARQWLSAPAIALGGEAPLDVLDTEVGAGMVRDLVGRLEHGVVA